MTSSGAGSPERASATSCSAELIVRLAPIVRATSSTHGLMSTTVMSSSTPLSRSDSTVIRPITPLPSTTARMPEPASAWSTACRATVSGSTSAADLSESTPAGTRFSAGASTYCAIAPGPREPMNEWFSHSVGLASRHCPHRPHGMCGATATRVPTGVLQPGPVAATAPENSWPSTCGKACTAPSK